ncbi:hypothetical protein [Selenomonas sp. FC4001]|uniref:hypothetical protein n=1 Tax=Selenomonas sp. FC4001 TaxID=1408313 RepID=UPI0018CC4CAC|nr:hypothetical protein [Selenomonas sp. FC4001]
MIADVLGAATAGFGYFAWVSFLFAGTGLAMPICIAIMVGGAAMLKYSNEIAEWLGKTYPCPKCGYRVWKTVTEDGLVLEDVRKKAVTIESYNEISVFPVMRKMYEDAEEYLYLSFPWYNIKYVQDDFPMLRDALSRGVKIFIYYGIKPRGGKLASSDEASARRTLRAIDWLKENLGERNVTYCPVDCHKKIMVCEKYSLQGSHNLFTYRPEQRDRGELMTKMAGKKAVEDARKAIISQPKLIQFDELSNRRKKRPFFTNELIKEGCEMTEKDAVNLAHSLGMSLSFEAEKIIVKDAEQIRSFDCKEEFLYWMVYIEEVNNSVFKYGYGKNPYIEWDGEKWVPSDFSQKRANELLNEGIRKHKCC